MSEWTKKPPKKNRNQSFIYTTGFLSPDAPPAARRGAGYQTSFLVNTGSRDKGVSIV